MLEHFYLGPLRLPLLVDRFPQPTAYFATRLFFGVAFAFICYLGLLLLQLDEADRVFDDLVEEPLYFLLLLLRVHGQVLDQQTLLPVDEGLDLGVTFDLAFYDPSARDTVVKLRRHLLHLAHLFLEEDQLFGIVVYLRLLHSHGAIERVLALDLLILCTVIDHFDLSRPDFDNLCL